MICSGGCCSAKPSSSSDWELPGGIVEPFETPRQGAIREVAEELGIDLAVGRLLVVDWMPPISAGTTRSR